MNSIENQVAIVISRAAMIPVEQVTPDAKLVALGISSLDYIECVMGVEQVFQIEIDRDDLKQFETVQDVIDAVREATRVNG